MLASSGCSLERKVLPVVLESTGAPQNVRSRTARDSDEPKRPDGMKTNAGLARHKTDTINYYPICVACCCFLLSLSSAPKTKPPTTQTICSLCHSGTNKTLKHLCLCNNLDWPRLNIYIYNELWWPTKLTLARKNASFCNSRARKAELSARR